MDSGLIEISDSSRCENFKSVFHPGILESGIGFGLGVYGVFCSIVACATFGKNKKVNKRVRTSAVWLILEKNCFLRMASILNPEKISKLVEKYNNGTEYFFYGTLSSKTTLLIFAKAEKLSEDNIKSKTSNFKKHVVSRFLFALAALVSIIIRIVDSILGFLGSLLVLFTCAKYEKINEFALKNIGLFGGILIDVCLGGCGVFNPKIVHDVNS